MRMHLQSCIDGKGRKRKRDGEGKVERACNRALALTSCSSPPPSLPQLPHLPHRRETHRWNFGLEEDLDEDGDPKWNHPVRILY